MEKKNQMNLDIYVASKDDFIAIQKIQFECFKKTDSVQKLKKKISEEILPAGKNENHIYCAKNSGFVGGFAHVRIENETPIILQIAVVPSVRGIGVGSKILKAIEDVHACHGVSMAEVSGEYRDQIGFFICNGYHMFGYKNGKTLLRKDAKVSEATVSRLKDLFQGRNLGKEKHDE